MKLVVLLLGLLMVRQTLFQKRCQKEQKTWYYIYNTTVDIKAFYCFRDVGDDFLCEKFNAKMATVRAKDARRYCPPPSPGSKLKQVFCELPAQANLLKNTVVLVSNITCQYDKYHCIDTSVSTIVFWTNNSVCNKYTLQTYKAEFDVWTVAKNGMKVIDNGKIGLILTSKDEFCGIEIWKTNYEDVIVSTAGLNSSIYKNYSDFKQKFKNISKWFCETKSSKAILRTWYVYRYRTDVTLYGCHDNSLSSCEGMIAALRNVELLDLCKKVCDSSTCKPNAQFCKKIHKIDLQNDAVIGLPGCKYSDRVCKPLGVFWYYTNRCRDVQEVYEAYEEPFRDKKSLNTFEDNSIELILERKGRLCGQIVWYTNQLGLVASEEKLGFINSKNIVRKGKKQRDSSWFHPEPDVDSAKFLGSGSYYLIIPLAVCVFGIVLKIAVYPVYLCMKCKKRKRTDCNNEKVELQRIELDGTLNKSVTRTENSINL